MQLILRQSGLPNLAAAFKNKPSLIENWGFFNNIPAFQPHRGNLVLKTQNWPNDFFDELETVISNYPNIANEAVANIAYFNHFSMLFAKTTFNGFTVDANFAYKFHLKYHHLQGHNTGINLNLQNDFINYLDDLPTESGGNIGSAPTALTLGNLWEDEISLMAGFAFNNVNFDRLPQLRRYANDGYEIITEQLHIRRPNGDLVIPDLVLARRSNGVVDRNNLVYIEIKVYQNTDFSDAQRDLIACCIGNGVPVEVRSSQNQFFDQGDQVTFNLGSLFSLTNDPNTIFAEW